jgi:MFS family permease
MINVLPKNPLTYRWIILAVSFLLITITNGLTLGGLVVLDEEIIYSLSQITGENVLIADLKLRDAITLWSTAVFGFFVGVAADKFSVKKLMVSGLLIFSACFWQYSQAESLNQMYIIHIFMGLVLCISGMLVNVILISRWFKNSRGLAIGILLAGTSTGNGLFPQINTYLLTFGDWREVMTWLSFIPLFLIPFVLVFVKDGPEKLLQTDKEATGQEIGEMYTEKKFIIHRLQKVLLMLWHETKIIHLLLQRVLLMLWHETKVIVPTLKLKNFWLLSLMAFCTFYAILAMLGHVFLMMREENYAPQVAATGLSIIFLGGFIGKVISGQLAETFGRKKILLAGVGVMLMGSIFIVLALFYNNPYFVWIGLALYGSGWGSLYTLIQLLTVDLFGIIALGKIMGVINIFDTLGGGLGLFFTGYLYDQTQGYVIPFTLISVLLVIAFISSSMLKIDDKEIQENR